MNRLWQKIVAGVKAWRGRSSRAVPKRRAVPRLELLEDRLVPAVTDMTELARMFPAHGQPTHLYLNFGWCPPSIANLTPLFYPAWDGLASFFARPWSGWTNG